MLISSFLRRVAVISAYAAMPSRRAAVFHHDIDILATLSPTPSSFSLSLIYYNDIRHRHFHLRHTVSSRISLMIYTLGALTGGFFFFLIYRFFFFSQASPSLLFAV